MPERLRNFVDGRPVEATVRRTTNVAAGGDSAGPGTRSRATAKSSMPSLEDHTRIKHVMSNID
jgi:hypothetical protein